MGSMCKICSFIAMFGCIILINFYNKWSMSKICSFNEKCLSCIRGSYDFKF